MISIRQIDAGLALLGLHRSDLAAALGLNKSTLNAYFTGQTGIPSGRLREVQTWLENAGIAFLEDEGVKFNRAEIVKYEGSAGFRYFMEDVVETMKAAPGIYCVSNVDEHNWLKWLGEEQSKQIRDRTASLTGVRAHILVRQGDEALIAEHAEYRTVPDDLFYANTSFYVYGGKLALIQFEPENVSVRVLKNAAFAEAHRVMFNGVWNHLAEKAHG